MPPYNVPATVEHEKAASKLVGPCIDFLRKVRCYDDIDAIIGMPPSDPEKKYILPYFLAERIAPELKIKDLSKVVVKKHRTAQSKEIPVLEKLNNLKGSITVGDEVTGRKLLLLDDRYQSGVTMNYVAMLLLKAGAIKVFGLACEKTCRNDDNLHSLELDD